MFSIVPTCCRLEGLAASRRTRREQGPCRWPSRALSCISVSLRLRWGGMLARSRQSLPTRVTSSLQRRKTVTQVQPPPAGMSDGAARESLGNCCRARVRRRASCRRGGRPGLLHRDHRLQRAGRQAAPAGRPSPGQPRLPPLHARRRRRASGGVCGPRSRRRAKTSPASRASAEPGSPLETGRSGC